MSSLSTFSTEQLLVIQTLVSNALSGTPSAAGQTQLGKNGKPVKLTKSGKVSKRTGKPTVHADFTKHILAEHKDDVAAFKAEHPDQKGAHLSFAANYRKEHAEEFEAFKTKWSEEHPKTDSDADASDAAYEDSGEAPAAVVADGAKVKKPRAPLTQEHKDAMQAGRQKKKAEKEAAAAAAEAAAKGDVAAPIAAPVVAAAAPVAAAAVPVKKQVKQAKKAETTAPAPAPAPKAPEPLPASPKEEVEEAENEYIPFTLAGKKYVRLGERRTDGNHIWASGDLWENKKGQKGPYVGVLQDDGKIDNTATEPEIE
jgi:hypothetical protein